MTVLIQGLSVNVFVKVKEFYTVKHNTISHNEVWSISIKSLESFIHGVRSDLSVQDDRRHDVREKAFTHMEEYNALVDWLNVRIFDVEREVYVQHVRVATWLFVCFWDLAFHFFFVLQRNGFFFSSFSDIRWRPLDWERLLGSTRSFRASFKNCSMFHQQNMWWVYIIICTHHIPFLFYYYVYYIYVFVCSLCSVENRRQK